MSQKVVKAPPFTLLSEIEAKENQRRQNNALEKQHEIRSLQQSRSKRLRHWINSLRKPQTSSMFLEHYQAEQIILERPTAPVPSRSCTALSTCFSTADFTHAGVEAEERHPHSPRNLTLNNPVSPILCFTRNKPRPHHNNADGEVTNRLDCCIYEQQDK